MPDYDAAIYGDRIAEIHDEWYAVPSDAEDTVSRSDTVAFLSDLADPGPALELGIGTGRIALPLAQRGYEVHGVDASEAMVEKLRGKTGGESIRVSVGDFDCESVGEAGAVNRLRRRAASTSRSTNDKEAYFLPPC